MAIVSLWVSVSTVEIDSLARSFELAAESLYAARVMLRGVVAELAWQPWTPALGEARALTIEAQARAAALGSAVRGRAVALRRAARAYDGAESTTTWDRIVNLASGPWAGPAVGVGDLATVLRNLVVGRPLLPGSLAAEVMGSSGIAALGAISSRVVVPGAQHRLGRARDDVVLEPVRSSDGLPAAGSAADLADRIALAYAASGEGASAIDIQRVAHVDGTVSWTVAVPGTMGGAGPGATQPLDPAANLPAYLGWSTAAEALVLAAMLDAGIEPGEPVVLAGHSQGGMTVTRLAGDPGVRERFTIAALVTFGAPVAHLPASGVPALHVVHAEDGVPALSGRVGSRAGGPAQGEIVVVRELGAAAGSLLAAHQIATYAATTRRAAARGGPGIALWERGTAGMWARGGDTVSATTHRGRRR